MKKITRKNFVRGMGAGTAAILLNSFIPKAQAGFCTDLVKLTTGQTAVRKTRSGLVKGLEEDGVEIYYGIPYGADPSGELRWQAPQPPKGWLGLKDCTEKEPIAIQMKTSYGADGSRTRELDGTTDCLNLDVVTTSDAEELPVMIYIHGGNNQTGSSYADGLGAELVRNTECVLVSLNYRTGLLGFNCLSALHTKSGSTGNYTMLDIAMALEWVRDNIAEFGGDPDNVTVTGFSAGGRNVMAMLVSPLYKGLFRQAIAFSGGMTICDLDAAARKDAELIAPLVVEDGIADTEEQAAVWLLGEGQEVRDYLYSIRAERLTEIMTDAGIRMAKFPHLFGDDIVLPANGFVGADYCNDVPVMMLTGTTEFSLFSAYDGYFYSIQDEDARTAAKEFCIGYGSDLYRIFNTQLSAETMYPNYTSEIYLCQINYGGNNSDYRLSTMGSFHGIFLPMLTSQHTYSGFGDFSNAGHAAMSSAFNLYLKNFLHTGTPNGEDALAEWQSWDTQSHQTMTFDASAAGEAIVEMQDVYKTNAEIIAEIEVDTSVSADTKRQILTRLLNGRWFSDELDAYFGTPSLW